MIFKYGDRVRFKDSFVAHYGDHKIHRCDIGVIIGNSEDAEFFYRVEWEDVNQYGERETSLVTKTTIELVEPKPVELYGITSFWKAIEAGFEKPKKRRKKCLKTSK